MSMSREAVKESAANILSNNRIFEPEIDLDKIAGSLGVDVKYEDLDDDVSGFLLVNHKGKTIVINENHPRNRQRFTMAHEIGHHELHLNENSTEQLFLDEKFYRSANPDPSSKQQEREANMFAAELLMPEELLKAQMLKEDFNINNETHSLILAKRFGVSEQAMNFRIGNLGLISY